MKRTRRALVALALTGWFLTTTTAKAADDLKERTTLKAPTVVSSVAFSPDGKTLVVASADKTVQLWDVSTSKNTSTLIGHSDEAWSAHRVEQEVDGGCTGREQALSHRGARSRALDSRLVWWRAAPGKDQERHGAVVPSGLRPGPVALGIRA
jgi:hypothetical protein